MKFFMSLVICGMCVSLTFSVKNTYKAAVVRDVDNSRYTSLIYEAAKSNVDILVLPPLQAESTLTGSDYYDEAIKSLSSGAKNGRMYLVAHLYEKALCQNRIELIRNNVVFDRDGTVISIYRKSLNTMSNCTAFTPEITSFPTDFGVKFGLLMEEDVVLENFENLKSLKNFVVTGSWSSDIPFLRTSQISSPWAYVSDANLITTSGIYAGKAGSIGVESQLIVVDLNKDGGSGHNSNLATKSKNLTFPDEDLSQYTIQPLHIETGAHSYSETVCHESFCCDFHMKVSRSSGNKVSYGLAVFEGVRHFGRGHNVGVHTCAVVACAGAELYKQTCAIGSSNNSTDTHFEVITVTGNFQTSKTAQFPLILTTDELVNFKIGSITADESRKVTVEMSNSRHLLAFGVIGRDYSRDFKSEYTLGVNNTDMLTSDIYDYFYNEDVQEFFDYVWIRLRILIFVVSIYILEML